MASNYERHPSGQQEFAHEEFAHVRQTEVSQLLRAVPRLEGKARGRADTVRGRRPTDLTELNWNNKGKFPDPLGSAQMPVRGPILGRVKAG